jgi:hypothetical protein
VAYRQLQSNTSFEDLPGKEAQKVGVRPSELLLAVWKEEDGGGRYNRQIILLTPSK